MNKKFHEMKVREATEELLAKQTPEQIENLTDAILELSEIIGGETDE